MQDFYSFDEYSIPFWIRELYYSIYIAVYAYAIWKLFLSAPKNKKNSDVTRWFILFFVLYVVFYCINPDYFRYREWIYGRDFSLWDKEQFYVYVILLCRRIPFDYPFEVFRLIVWGGAIAIAYFTFRLYRSLLLPGLALLLLFVFNAGTVSYARASLGMAVYFLGIALYLYNKDKMLLLRALGIALAVSSYYLHREMIVAIGLLPILFIPLEKKRMAFVSVFGLVAAIIGISFFINNTEYLDSIFDNDDITSKMEDFNEQEQGAFRLSTFIGYIKYFYPFYLITKIFWRKKLPHMVSGMYRITYGILMASVAFMVVSGLRSVYTYRVMYISMIPMALLTGYCYCNGYFKKKELEIMMSLALVASSIRFVNAQ